MLIVALAIAPAAAQTGPDAQPPVLTPSVQSTTPLPLTDAQRAAPAENVVDIIIKGNRNVSRDKVLANIGTRIGRPFDQVTFEKDIRKLTAKNWFVHVHPLPREHVAGGVIITLEVVERPTLEYVKFLGNKKIKQKKLANEAGLKKGDPLDIYAVQDGQRKDRVVLPEQGFNDVKVTILEGNKPGDHGAVYLINEGVIQKFKAVNFVGNSPTRRARWPAAGRSSSRSPRCSGSSRDRSTARRSTRTSTSCSTITAASGSSRPTSAATTNTTTRKTA